MKLNIIVIVILGFSILFVTNQAYAPCIEGPGINCNNYPPPALTQISADKLNYETTDKPIVTIVGAPDAVAHLEIDDSASNIIFTHGINMSPNGTVGYVLDISSYKPGVYSVIVTSPISKLKTSFSVGLAPTGGHIVIQSDRNSYLPGDNVAIVGTWNSNTLIQLSLIDPSGISVKSSQTFSDKTGHFSSHDIVIPMDAISGIWQIGADSGITHTRIQISVNSTVYNHSKIKLDETAVLSPLKQFKGGTIAHDVHCNSGLQLVLKAEYYTPACVKPETASKLVQRGWALDTTLPEPFIKKITITGLQQNYTIGQPINATVTYAGYYWYVEPDVKILDANGTQIWFNCAYCYARTEPVPSPAFDIFTYVVRDYSSNKLPVINKTGTYTMIASLENKTASAEFTIVKPLMPNRIAGLENDAGIATLGNQTYYFETPHYANTAFSNPVRISFHGVVFTLFPPGFKGGLPTGVGCEGTTTGIISGSGSYYWTDAKFPDGSHELLNIFGYSKLSCPVHSIPTDFSTHTNPQAGLTFYNGKMKLLVSTNNQISSALKLYMSTDFDMIKPGQPIGITISVHNILATPVEITSQNNWSYQNVSTGPCSTIGYGISILDGFYDTSNMTQGKSLSLFNPGILCPVIQETAKVYEFQPQSDNVKEVQCKSIDGLQCRTDVYSMGQDYKFNGYWDAGTVQHFKSGVYTIIGADEWGHVEIQHFIVTNSTIFTGNLGSMSCPLMSGGTQFSAIIKNSTGFANYYNSTQYGNTFLLHPGMHGVIHVQYISPVNTSWFENNGNKPFTVINGATLFYMANVTQGKSTTSYAVSLYDDKTGHHSRICHYATPWGGFAEPCNMDNSGDIPPSELPYASQLLHPGITTSFEPDSTMLYPNDSPGFTTTISTNSDAMSGTYWISLGPSLCGPHVLAKLVVVP